MTLPTGVAGPREATNHFAALSRTRPKAKPITPSPTKAEVMARTPDPALREMLAHLEQIGIATPFDRFDQQKPHCAFGLEGTCCKVCHMGPCRVTPKKPRGVCGADANLIAARNILRWTAAGVASHGARGREVMLALKGAAEGTLDLPILGPEKVRATAKAFGIDDPEKSVADLKGKTIAIPSPFSTHNILRRPDLQESTPSPISAPGANSSAGTPFRLR